MGLDTFLIRQWHYTRLGFKLAHVGVGARSIVLIALLGLLIQLKGRSHWRDLAVGVRIRVGDSVFPLRLAARTELEVMREIFIEREYWLPRSDRRMTIFDLGEAHRVADRDPRELLARIEESMCVSVRRGDSDRIAFFAERCEGRCSCRIGESDLGELPSR